MTVLIGILCKDGIVIGADSSATSSMGQFRLMEQPTKKIDIIDNHIIVAGTGEVGLGQRFRHLVENAWNNKVFQNHHIDVGRTLAQQAINDFSTTKTEKGKFGALVAFHCGSSFHLCEFAEADLQPEFKEANRFWYVTMGSGQVIADPFFAFLREVFWKTEMPSCQDGVLAAVWALSHTIDINAGGVNGPMDIAVLRSKKGKFEASRLGDAELDEHKQNIDAMKETLRQYKGGMVSSNSSPAIP